MWVVWGEANLDKFPSFSWPLNIRSTDVCVCLCVVNTTVLYSPQLVESWMTNQQVQRAMIYMYIFHPEEPLSLHCSKGQLYIVYLTKRRKAVKGHSWGIGHSDYLIVSIKWKLIIPMNCICLNFRLLTLWLLRWVDYMLLHLDFSLGLWDYIG